MSAFRAAALAALAVAVCIAPARAAPSSGKVLYEERCSSCHGLALQGSIDGPPLIGKGAADVDFMLRTGRMPAPVAWQEQFSHPPAFDDADIRALVQYVMRTGHGDPSLPNPERGNALQGRNVFVENCEACHGVTARGASVGFSEVAPSLQVVPPMQIAEAVRTGPGVMPAFGNDVLSRSDLDDVIAYIGLLHERPRELDPGGLSLGNVGPVAEGFIAWFFGLGLLVLLCRWIGTTT